MEIIQYLEFLQLAKSCDILNYKSFQGGYFIKIIAELINYWKLQITEFVDTTERNHSYHLQDINNNLIIRFDNSPHYKNLPSFPIIAI